MFVGSIVVLAAALAYSVYLLTNLELSETDATPITNGARLNITSLAAYSIPNHEIIDEIEPGMTFQRGEPVTLQANFTNPNNAKEEFVIIVDLRNTTNTVAYSLIQSSFENSNRISTEVLWTPQNVGDYRMMVFLLKTSELNSTKLMIPISSVPLRVIE